MRKPEEIKELCRFMDRAMVESETASKRDMYQACRLALHCLAWTLENPNSPSKTMMNGFLEADAKANRADAARNN